MGLAKLDIADCQSDQQLAWVDCSASVITKLFGCTLLVASGLKAQALLSPDGALFQRVGTYILPIWLAWSIVGIESLLGACILTGTAARYVRFCAIGIVTIFLVVGSVQLAHGARTCGCFGRLPVLPQITLVIDGLALLAVAALAIRSRSRGTKHSQRGSLDHGIAKSLICAAFFGLGLTIGTQLPGAGETKLAADPSAWIGRAFPVADLVHGEDRDDLLHGNQRIFLFSSECADCRAVLRRLRETRPSPLTGLILIDLAGQNAGFPSSGAFRLIRLAGPVHYSGTLPLIVMLTNGVVKGVESTDSILTDSDPLT